MASPVPSHWGTAVVDGREIEAVYRAPSVRALRFVLVPAPALDTRQVQHVNDSTKWRACYCIYANRPVEDPEDGRAKQATYFIEVGSQQPIRVSDEVLYSGETWTLGGAVIARSMVPAPMLRKLERACLTMSFSNVGSGDKQKHFYPTYVHGRPDNAHQYRTLDFWIHQSADAYAANEKRTLPWPADRLRTCTLAQDIVLRAIFHHAAESVRLTEDDPWAQHGDTYVRCTVEDVVHMPEHYVKHCMQHRTSGPHSTAPCAPYPLEKGVPCGYVTQTLTTLTARLVQFARYAANGEEVYVSDGEWEWPDPVPLSQLVPLPRQGVLSLLGQRYDFSGVEAISMFRVVCDATERCPPVTCAAATIEQRIQHMLQCDGSLLTEFDGVQEVIDAEWCARQPLCTQLRPFDGPLDRPCPGAAAWNAFWTARGNGVSDRPSAVATLCRDYAEENTGLWVTKVSVELPWQNTSEEGEEFINRLATAALYDLAIAFDAVVVGPPECTFVRGIQLDRISSTNRSTHKLRHVAGTVLDRTILQRIVACVPAFDAGGPEERRDADFSLSSHSFRTFGMPRVMAFLSLVYPPTATRVIHKKPYGLAAYPAQKYLRKWCRVFRVAYARCGRFYFPVHIRTLACYSAKTKKGAPQKGCVETVGDARLIIRRGANRSRQEKIDAWVDAAPATWSEGYLKKHPLSTQFVTRAHFTSHAPASGASVSGAVTRMHPFLFYICGPVMLLQTQFVTSSTDPCLYTVGAKARHACERTPMGFTNPVTRSTPREKRKRGQRDKRRVSGHVAEPRPLERLFVPLAVTHPPVYHKTYSLRTAAPCVRGSSLDWILPFMENGALRRDAMNMHTGIPTAYATAFRILQRLGAVRFDALEDVSTLPAEAVHNFLTFGLQNIPAGMGSILRVAAYQLLLVDHPNFLDVELTPPKQTKSKQESMTRHELCDIMLNVQETYFAAHPPTTASS